MRGFSGTESTLASIWFFMGRTAAWNTIFSSRRAPIQDRFVLISEGSEICEVFIAEFDPTLSTLRYGTYFGDAGDDSVPGDCHRFLGQCLHDRLHDDPKSQRIIRGVWPKVPRLFHTPRTDRATLWRCFRG